MNKYDFNINGIEFSIYKDEDVWGDGQHESTQFMMSLITKYEIENKTIIDVGTGTGILSILCAKLGAKHVLALDNNAHSLEWARKNFKRNNVTVDVEINDKADYIDDKADIILSNLSPVAQVENIRTIAKNMNDNGILIMTWWNKIEFEDYAKDFKIIEYIQGKDYDAYVLMKK